MDQDFNPQGPVNLKRHIRLEKLKAFLRKRPPKKRLIAVASVSIGVLFIGGAMAFTLIKDDSVVTPAVIPEPSTEPVVEKFYSPLTGRETTEALAGRPVTSVMIENSIDARPQAGLEEAGIVFEAIAEGGITRFLALYQEDTPEKIGPIRSARPYYVRWARGFDAGYAHSGGSPEALALIPALGVKDLDHGKNSSYFDRVSNRFAPHNVYTSMARLDQYNQAQGYSNTSNFTPFTRESVEEEEEAPAVQSETTETPAPTPANPKANSVVFDISSVRYNTSYAYDAAANAYNRVMSQQPHVDEVSGKQITPEVIIALYMSYGIHPNGIHSVYGNVGTGEAEVFQNGEVIQAQWRKSSDTASLEILTADGSEPLPLVRGQTWITAIQKGRVSYSP